MGQRHQTLIKLHNPAIKFLKENADLEARAKDFTEKVDTWIDLKKRYNHLKEELGEGETTILAFHHQWLYGATACANALQVLRFAKNSKEDSENPFHKEFFTKGLRSRDIKDEAKFITDFVTNLMSVANSELHEMVGRVGFEHFTYLNPTEPYMREQFDRGDNNDGVTIIDTTTGKYCFASFDHTEGQYNIPLYVPVSAEEYAKSYYPTKMEKVSKYYKTKRFKDEVDPAKALADYLKDNISIVKKIKSLFKPYKVMTFDELKTMFPKVYEEIDVRIIGTTPKDDED